jgi:signal transduction histidine kinase
MTESGERRAKIGRVGLLTGFVLLTVVTVATYRMTAKLAEGSAGLERRERVLNGVVQLETALRDFEAEPCGPGGDRAPRVLQHLAALGGLPERETLRNLEALVQEDLEACSEAASSAPDDPARAQRWAVIRQELAALREGELSRLTADLDKLRQAARLAGPLAFLTSIATLALLLAVLGLMSTRRAAEAADSASEKDIGASPRGGATEINKEGTEERKAQARFLSGLSHALRTPLNAIGGFGDLLASGTAGPLTEKQQRFVENIRQASARLVELADEVRDLALIESGMMELKPELVRLNDVVAEALAAAGEAARQRVEVLSPRPEEALACYTDPSRLRQALERLLRAALRSVSEGDRLEISLAASGEAVEIQVAEKGAARFPEIPAEPVASAEGAKSASEIPAGAALELTLARRLTELQGGSLEVVSDSGAGRKFKMRLLRHTNSSNPVEKNEKNPHRG